MNLNKNNIRKAITKEIQGLHSKLTATIITPLIERIELLDEWQAAETIALYSALPDEIPTELFFRRWSGCKRIVLPVVSGSEMDFYEYNRTSTLVGGCFGILEPHESLLVAPSEIDLFIVPGVGFDLSGNRLGRGKGYYDKYLKHSTGYRLGVCLANQLVESLPSQEHDVQMNRVLTL